MKYFDPNGEPIDCNQFIQKYSELYFKYYPQNKIQNKETGDLIEDEINKKCTEGIFDFECVAWKIGRDYNEYKAKYDNGEPIPNGYGNLIDGVKLKNFLNEISNSHRLSTIFGEGDYSRSKIEEAFTILSASAPPNFGTVYIITVMYFLSKGAIPIYDQFAHKAIKAIYFEKKPKEVYVGSAPSKTEVTNAINMLDEYMWYLEKVFGTPHIARDIDRALWVYGHPQIVK